MSRCAVEQVHIVFHVRRDHHICARDRGVRERLFQRSPRVWSWVLFVLALAFFAASLVNLAREFTHRIALHDIDHYR